MSIYIANGIGNIGLHWPLAYLGLITNLTGYCRILSTYVDNKPNGLLVL